MPHPIPPRLVAALLVAALAACNPSPESPAIDGAATDGAATEPPPNGATVEPSATERAPLDVRTTSFPADWLVRRIGGERVKVTHLLPAGEDPPSWQPSGEVIAGLADADLIVANGAGFEAWMRTATLPGDRLVETAADVQPITIEGPTHSHGKGGEHSHAGVDPHTWSSPAAYRKQAAAVAAALTQADPASAAAFGDRLETLQRDLDTLGQRLKDATAPLREASLPLAASHPAFNYIGRELGLTIRSFHLDPEQPPSAHDAEDVAAWVAERKAAGQPAVLVWEAIPTDAVKAALPADLTHAYVDPLEQPGPDGTYDYLAQARANVRAWTGVVAAAGLGVEPAPEAPATP